MNIRKLNLDVKNINNNHKPIILNDGKRIYADKQIDKNIVGRRVNYSMTLFEFSEEYFKLYEQFINYIKDVHKTEVILVLTPYEQDSYNITVKYNPRYLEMENKFLDLAQKNNVQIVGSYNPNLFNCEKSEFYDYRHPKDSCMEKILNEIK